MDVLFIFIVASVLGALVIARVIIWSTDRASAAAITSYFKASEYILETGQPPPDWCGVPMWKRVFERGAVKPTWKDQLDRLDDLIRYFEHCSFFEDDWTREQLLSQLADVRDAWERSALS